MMSEGQVNKTQQKTSKVDTLAGLPAYPVGSEFTLVYKRVHDKDSDKNIVKEVDKFNLFEFIQSSRSSTDLALLEKRYLELGEIPQVDPTAGSVDFTQMPSNIHEVYNLVNDVDANFAKLPKSIQDVFGSSQAYMQSLLDGTYQATLINAINEASKKQKEEAKGENE